MKKRLLIIGGSGLVGSTLINYGSQDFELYATFNKNKIPFENVNSYQIDLLQDRLEIKKLIKKIAPHVTVHTAAHPSVDLCETDPKIADILHIEVTNDIALVCKEIESKLLYLSTDAVFEGELNKKYVENDLPNPVNHYGYTKLEAEKIVLAASSSNVVLRTAVIYGWHKKSRFSNWILQSLFQNKIVDPFVDQYNTPTLVDDLVKAIIAIINRNIGGLYHSTGKTCLNRYDFALILADVFGLNKKLIKPTTSQEKKQQAPRPVSTCLDSNKLEKILNFNFSDIKSGVNFVFNNYKKNPSLLSDF